MHKLLIPAVIAISLAFSACGKGDGPASSDGTGGGGGNIQGATLGPIDGTWKLTGILCNGTAATGTATQLITAPSSVTYSISNTSGSFTISSGGCAISSALTASYPGGGKAVVTPTGTWSCSPAGCAGATCGSAVANSALTYSYALSGTTLTAVVVAGTDQTCTGATPAQLNPVTDIFTKQ